jgi:hypothetical protein
MTHVFWRCNAPEGGMQQAGDSAHSAPSILKYGQRIELSAKKQACRGILYAVYLLFIWEPGKHSVYRIGYGLDVRGIVGWFPARTTNISSVLYFVHRAYYCMSRSNQQMHTNDKYILSFFFYFSSLHIFQ